MKKGLSLMNRSTSSVEAAFAAPGVGAGRGATLGGGAGAAVGILIACAAAFGRGLIPDLATALAVAAMGAVVFALAGGFLGVLVGGFLGGVGGLLHAALTLRTIYRGDRQPETFFLESNMNTTGRKMVVIGLDCADPMLVFGRFKGKLPNLEKLMAGGLYGRLRSCDPPITVPAWSVMMSSKDPGTLGIYGFRNRADHSYDRLAYATGTAVREPRVWDYLGQAGKKVIMLGVPGTYPPRPVNGLLVGCFLTPSITNNYTYPPDLKDEIAKIVHPYMLDVPDFRTEDKARLRTDIYRMTEMRFTLARHFLRSHPWDFFMMVEMGTDRVHHGFWKFMDPTHPRYEAGNPWEDVIGDYYQYVDDHIGQLLQEVPEDATVLVVSDHGAKGMEGGICINEWLIQKGYLVLHEYPKVPTRFAEVAVDWSRTVAWSEGGYYARVFLNVEGREPRGVLAQSRYQSFRDQLAREIESIPDMQGRSIGTRVLRPEDLYQQMNGVAPDLFAYFGQLRWRSVGTVGSGSIQTLENDTGPDDANHAEEGIFILSGPGLPTGRYGGEAQLMDIAPTILRLYGLPVPADMQGQPLILNPKVQPVQHAAQAP
jgi:predicted AlkP superfamily phosphohydrolase/phosphomutase